MTISNFTELINENEITIVKLGADFCQPCKVLGRKIESLEKELSDVKFIDIDIEEEPEIATSLNIRNIPVLLYYKNGEMKDMTVGMLPEQTIIDKINALR